jgi:hypothetical protein
LSFRFEAAMIDGVLRVLIAGLLLFLGAMLLLFLVSLLGQLSVT